LAFVISRTLFRDWVQRRFAHSLSTINRGIEKDGAFYLFSLRMVPLFPFFVINLVMGLTPIRAWTFYWVSQLGMLLGTLVYVNAGTRLGALESTSGLLSPALIASFVILAVFPWLTRSVLNAIKQRRALAGFARPDYFDNNLLVIGAGSGGLVAAYIAAMVKARVTLVEKNRMGGDCLNTGCVPSKAIIRSSRVNHYLKRASEFGIKNVSGEVDFAAVMQRVESIISQVEPHDSVARYTELGVNCIKGEARIISPWKVKIGNEVQSARNIIIASGGRPAIPDIPGIDNINYLSSDTIWQLQQQPGHLLVVGGGPIGCELAQAFSRLGSRVSMVVRSELLPREDLDVSAEILSRFRREGIEVLCRHELQSFANNAGQYSASLKHDGGEKTLAFDQVLFAVGRQANTENMGLETVGVEVNDNGTVAVDEHLRTSCPTIYACGDVAGPYQFTHVASHQAWYAAVNSLFGGFKKFKVDYSVIPWVTFCDPEVARVGINEREAKQQGVRYETTVFNLDDLDRAIADSETSGFIKVLTAAGSDKILGVCIVGYRASELIAEYILAMKHGLGLNKILSTIHIYPTFSEANKYVAGEWKKQRKPERLLRWVEKFHRRKRNA
jgi:dihydrolipoamide dehydrogenase